MLSLTEPLVTSPALEPADRAEAWRLRGLALFFLDRREEAADAYRRALELATSDPESRFLTRRLAEVT